MPLKNILIIIIILAILGIGVFGIYTFFFTSEEEPTIESTTEEPYTKPTTNSPSVISSSINQISPEPIIAPTIDRGKVKYYLASNGNVLEANFDGSGQTLLSSVILPDLVKVLWSNNKNKVIAIFQENGQAKKYSYDYTTKISTPLNDNIGWIAWSPDEDKIAYQYYNSATQENSISIANPDGSNWSNIFQTRMKDLIVEWPSSGQIAIRTKPSGLARSVVYTIDLGNSNFQKVLGESYGLSLLWSPLGDKILFSETNNQGKNLKLKIADLGKQAIAELDFATLPEKCVWSEDNRTIFCAVPQTIPSSAILPDDYYQNQISFIDDFWQINLDTEEAVQILGANDQEDIYDADQLILSPMEDYLLFINKRDNLLYSLEL
jgi:hypothetical protein